MKRRCHARLVNLCPDAWARGAALWLALATVGATSAKASDAAMAPPPETSKTARHWAFQPLVVGDSARDRADIDLLVRRSLQDAGLNPGRQADRSTLIRRVAFILTGLPPAPEEITSFVADKRSGAYSRMVERYLNSPCYGERWGQHWLDAAGYADSNGYFNADTDRPLAYRYRDYVIRAVNHDKPFDQFVREQLAGDELSGWKPGHPATPEIIELLEATHYLRNGQDGSGESDGNPDEVRTDRYYALESAMQIIGSSLLGVTVQCAKCHDHKFEPFKQTDYYSLQAVLYPAFNVEKWVKPNDRVVHANLPGELEAWEANEKNLNAELAELKSHFNTWVATNRPAGQILFKDGFNNGESLSHRWSNAAPTDDAPAGSPSVTLDSDKAPAARVQEGALQIIEGGGSGDRWLSTKMAFEWQPASIGQWIQVTFDLVDTTLNGKGNSAERIGYVIAARDFNDNGDTEGGNILIDGNPGGATSVHVDYPGADSKSRGAIGETGYQAGHRYGVRITRTATNALTLEHLVDDAVDGGSLTLRNRDLPAGGFAFEYCCGRSFIVDNVVIEGSNDSAHDWVAANAAFQKALAEHKHSFDTASKAIAAKRPPKPGRIAWMTDGGAKAPEVHLLKRGNHKTPGDVIEPTFPAFLKAPGTAPAAFLAAKAEATTGRRLAWADWLVKSNSPQASLFARVSVNRVWQQYFGVGIVATPDNLGVSGAKPSHPELLDWLATQFIESGWSMRQLHRLILGSKTFQQSSEPRERAVARDPDNRLLWRFPIRRLDAEAIRDAMLTVCGRISSKTNGPYVPTPRSGNGEVMADESKADGFARSIFLQHRRTQVPTFLGTFDAPSIVFNCTRRAETTMPLQSLSLLNAEFAVKRGEDLARRLQRDCGDDEIAKICRGFMLTAGRKPDSTERNISKRFLAEQRLAYHDKPDADVRAWADFCQSLFGLNSFLYLE